jgi:hypothetical protein
MMFSSAIEKKSYWINAGHSELTYESCRYNIKKNKLET